MNWLINILGKIFPSKSAEFKHIEFPELPTNLTAQYIHEYYVQKQIYERYSVLTQSCLFALSNFFLITIYLILLIHPISTFINSVNAGAYLNTALIFIICLFGVALSAHWESRRKRFLMFDKNLQNILAEYQTDWSECVGKGNDTMLSFKTTPNGKQFTNTLSNTISAIENKTRLSGEPRTPADEETISAIENKTRLSRLFQYFWIVNLIVLIILLFFQFA